MNRRGFLGFLAALGFGGKAAAEAVVRDESEPEAMPEAMPESIVDERSKANWLDESIMQAFRDSGDAPGWDHPGPPWERSQIVLTQGVAAEDIEPLELVAMTDTGDLVPHRPWDGYPPAIGYSARGGKAGDLVDFFLAVPEHALDQKTDPNWLGEMPSMKKWLGERVEVGDLYGASESDLAAARRQIANTEPNVPVFGFGGTGVANDFRIERDGTVTAVVRWDRGPVLRSELVAALSGPSNPPERVIEVVARAVLGPG